MMKVFALLMALQQEPQGDACGFDPETIREEGVAAEEKQGQEEGAQEELPLKVEPVVGAEWESQWFPKEVLYRNYMADPLTPRSGSKLMFPFRKEDNIKIENCLGTQRTVWRRLDPDGREGLDV
ncbi:MAG: hypothetical protein HYY16_18840, partial [Planctomycetes bacterium]|nr:hypothetical protein [Planctomycetota bacterium]